MPTSDKLVPSGSVKDKTAKTLFQRLMRNAFLDEPVRPVSNRAYGNAKRYLLRKTHARTSWRRVLPRKKGENGARMANPIAIVEVIGAGIVEVYGLLDEPQTDDVLVELKVTFGVTGNCRHVMDA